jgi:hypothetical protein
MFSSFFRHVAIWCANRADLRMMPLNPLDAALVIPHDDAQVMALLPARELLETAAELKQLEALTSVLLVLTAAEVVLNYKENINFVEAAERAAMRIGLDVNDARGLVYAAMNADRLGTPNPFPELKG